MNTTSQNIFLTPGCFARSYLLKVTGIEAPLVEREADLFTALVERRSRFVFRVAYAVLRNSADAEHVAQETFFKLYRSGAWQAMEDEAAFLARAAWRIAVGRVPKRRRETVTDALPANHPGEDDRLIAADRQATLHRLIDGLPEELRFPLALSTADELNSRQIAEVMGMAEGTVRTRLLRARQVLKQKIAALEGNWRGNERRS